MIEICTLYINEKNRAALLRLRQSTLNGLGLRNETGKVILLVDVRHGFVILKPSKPLEHNDVVISDKI